MTGEERGSGGEPDGASARSRAFVAHRAAVDEATQAADAALAQHQAAAQQHQQLQAENQNPLVLLAGLAVLILLLAGFVFILDRLRDDPWYSDCPAGNCR